MNVEWGHAQSAGTRRVNALLAADPFFRHLAEGLESELLRGEIATALPEVASPRLQVDNVWYIPRKSLQVVYRAGPFDDAGCGGDTLFRVRFHPSGVCHAPSAVSAAGEQARARTLPGLGAVGWVFPEDPELPQLAAVANERYLAQRLGAGGRWRSLSYLPGRRCALHHRRDGEAAGVVLRVQAPHDAAKSYARVRAAWSAGSRQLRMPEPLGHDLQAGAFWERFVPGERLDTLLGSARLDAALEDVVQGVVRLHGLRLPHLPVEGTAEILDGTRKAVAKARCALPGLGAALDTFVRGLSAAASRVDEAAAVTLHGDLHTANLLIGEEGVVFIDFDRMATGHPAQDLALLGTRLLLLGLNRGAGLQEVAGRVAALPELYRQAGGRAIPPEAFAWHVAALLVGRQIKTVIRHLAPDVERLAPTLLAWAERTLELGRFEPSVVSGVRDDVEGIGNADETAHAA